jgi:hypothetical protein
MLKVIMTAAVLSLMVCAGASAFPAPKSQVNASSSHLIPVVKKHHNKHYKAYKHGYKHPPKGWRSYSHRPALWGRRGCIVIDKAWFCP